MASTWSLGFGHPSRYQPRSTGLNFGEQTGTGVFPTWWLGFGHPSRYQPRSTGLNFGEQTGTGVFPTWWLGFGHPSRYQPRSTGLNFAEQTGTGVFPREQSLMFCYISFSKDEQFSSNFFEESFFCVPNYINISLQVTSPRTMKTTSLTRIYSNCLQSFIPE